MGKREVDDGDGIGVGVQEELGDEGTVGGGGEDGDGEVGEAAAEEVDEVKKRNGVAFCHEWKEDSMTCRLGN